jgi:hypothetical protein
MPADDALLVALMTVRLYNEPQGAWLPSIVY